MHLFIVVTERCNDDQRLLLSVTSVRAGKAYDTACEFVGGEHEFIRHHSYISYRHADRVNERHIQNMVSKRLYEPKSDLAMDQFDRVCSGIGVSKFVKPWVLSYYNDNQPD